MKKIFGFNLPICRTSLIFEKICVDVVRFEDMLANVGYDPAEGSMNDFITEHYNQDITNTIKSLL